MTIKEFCQKYKKDEANVRAKIYRYKSELNGHVSKKGKTSDLDDFAIEFLLNDRRSHSSLSEDSSPADTAEPVVQDKDAEKENPNMNQTYKYWNTDRIQKVMNICLEEVQKNHKALYYIPNDFKTFELCEAAVKSHGIAIQYVPEKYLTEELCKTAVNTDSVAFAFVPENYKTDDMIHTAFNNYERSKSIALNLHTEDREIPWRLLKYVPQGCITEDICIKAIKVSGWNAQYIPKELFTDKIIQLALKSNAGRKYIPKEYWTKDNIIKTIKEHGLNMSGIPTELFNFPLYIELINTGVIMPEDVHQNRAYSGILSEEELNKIIDIDHAQKQRYDEIYELIIKEPHNIMIMSPDDDRYDLYAMIAVARCGDVIRYVPKHKRSFEICNAAVTQNIDTLLYVPEEFKEQIIGNIRKRPDFLTRIFNDGYFSEMLLEKYGNID